MKILKSDANDLPIDLSDEKISITGQKDISTKDAPATVSVITEDDILRSGARDLMDVLRLVPGFEFGVDVQGIAALGVRGNSANEGSLVLVDGLEFTEILYASNLFGSFLPLDQVWRIEVIRGPGSVMYGGFAVYSVINILTKASEEYNGFKVSNTIGETAKNSPRRNFSASFGGMYEKFNFSVSSGFSNGNRSDGIYSNATGNSYDMTQGTSALSDRFISIRANAGRFSAKILADHYQVMNRDNVNEITSKAYPVNFSSFIMDIRHDFLAAQNVSLKPYFTFRKQLPWETPNKIDSLDVRIIEPLKVATNRITSGLNIELKPTQSIDILCNGSLWRDFSQDVLNPDSGLSASFLCQTAFAQGTWKTKVANFSLGLRFDHHSYYSPFFSPRLAINKSFGNFYGKFSFNRSFRTPAIANIIKRIGNEIKPQRTDYFDLEIGGKLNSHFTGTLNLFRINVQDGIIYEVLSNTLEGYSNDAKLGTRGAEAQLVFRNENGVVMNGSWSFYRNLFPELVNPIHVPSKGLNLAFPSHKLCLNTKLPINKHFSLNGTFIFLSNRYGFNGSEEEPFYINYGPVFQWNAFLEVKDVYLKGLSLGLGIFDIFNSQYNLIQPYRSFHMPLPGLSREFTFRVSYGLLPDKFSSR